MKEYKLSEIRKLADKSDYIGSHLESHHYDSYFKTDVLDIRLHTMPSYGYDDPDYEDTDEWYDDWWSLMICIDLKTNKIIDVYKNPGDFEEGDVVIIDCNIPRKCKEQYD